MLMDVMHFLGLVGVGGVNLNYVVKLNVYTGTHVGRLCRGSFETPMYNGRGHSMAHVATRDHVCGIRRTRAYTIK